jgi:acyl carrier protein
MNHDRENCLEIVRFAIALHADIPPDAIAEIHRLDSDLGLAPLDLVQVALHLEELGHSEFPVADLEWAESVADLADIVRAWCEGEVADGSPSTGPPGSRRAPRTFARRPCRDQQ